MRDDDQGHAIVLPADAAFWALVELAREGWHGFERRLRELPTPTLAGFAHMFFGFEAALAGRSRELLASEDAADDFCGWVVARGKALVVQALADPRSLDEAAVERFDGEVRSRLDCCVRYAAEAAYEARTGEALGPFVDPAFDPRDSAEYGPLIRAAP